MKKLVILFLIALILPTISAINLDISTKPVSDTIITELDQPAVFELTLRNLEETDTFEIYSVIGLELSQKDPFTIGTGDKKTLIIEVGLPKTLKSPGRRRAFEYKIRNLENEIQREEFIMDIIKLEDAFLVTQENINPESESTSFSIKNIATSELNLSLDLDSAFFTNQTEISLKPSEIKEIQIPIDKEKIKSLSAGNYLTNIEITVEDQRITKEALIKFLEQEGIDTQETEEGVLIKRQEILKKNIGNVRKEVEITIEKNIFEYLFTTITTEPTEIFFQDSRVTYTWKKELIPNEELKVVVKTNWYYPIIIIILIILVVYLIKRSIETDLMLRKKVSFIKTKGGQFALKVSLKLKAKRFIERINLIDKLPPLVQLYNKFGVIAPDNIDINNRRLEWNIETLNKDEERIFTYIIYSRVGVVGRFELPEARATYEKDGRIKHQISNRSFYINEPRED